CFCGEVRYKVEVEKADDVKTSICHCGNCKKFSGGAYSIATKVPLTAFKITRGFPKQHTCDNRSGSVVHRQFCATCGSPIAEWGSAIQDSARYIFYGTFDNVGEQAALDPKREVFTSRRVQWLVPVRDTLQEAGYPASQSAL
ncbi:hypothetical protein RHOSPDRAFT_21595, partial [Rhodotorula sp. JG-1b]